MTVAEMGSSTTVRELSDDEIERRLHLLTGDGAAEGDGLRVGSSPTPDHGRTDPDLALGGEAQAESVGAATTTPQGPTFRFIRPLVDAADSLIAYLQNTEGRFMFGLPELDVMTRGLGHGELAYLTGYTHSGKTQVFLTGAVNNRDRRVVLVTMDETAEQVLTKLVCMLTGSNAERLEERVKARDQDAINRVRRIAREDFKNLIVVDGSMRLDDLNIVIKEAEDFLGGPIDLLGLDYLELLKTDDSDVEGKSQSLKAWVVSQHFPVLCLHQGSRGNSGGGQKLSMNSMKYAGEAEATFVIGVRRQKDDPDMADDPRVADTVEISLIKNKRPPSRKGEYSYYLDPNCGLILPLAHRPNR